MTERLSMEKARSILATRTGHRDHTQIALELIASGRAPSDNFLEVYRLVRQDHPNLHQNNRPK